MKNILLIALFAVGTCFFLLLYEFHSLANRTDEQINENINLRMQLLEKNKKLIIYDSMFAANARR